jgi:hypothetical protein
MYYKVILKDGELTYRYVVLADSPAEARKYAREHHLENVRWPDIRRVTVSPELIDDVI